MCDNPSSFVNATPSFSDRLFASCKLLSAFPKLTIAIMSSPECRWWSSETVAVVTGGNKGIGREIARRLAREGLTVILTARDEARGLEAAQSLRAQGLHNHVVFHTLDISSPASRAQFAQWIREAYGGLDILVNNAAVFHNDNVYATAVETMEINYRGTVELIRSLLPLFKASPAGARIVNVSSLIGQVKNVNNEELRKKLADVSQFDEQFLDKLEQEFLEACKVGHGEPNSYANTAYRFSKVLLNCYSRLLAQRLASRPEGHQISVHNAHPGFVMTGMHRKFWKNLDEESYQAQLASGKFIETGAVTVEDGADTPVWLCLLPPGDSTPSGLFWGNRQLLSY